MSAISEGDLQFVILINGGGAILYLAKKGFCLFFLICHKITFKMFKINMTNFMKNCPSLTLDTVVIIKDVPYLSIKRILPGHHRLSITVDIISRIENEFSKLSDEGKLKQGNGGFLHCGKYGDKIVPK